MTTPQTFIDPAKLREVLVIDTDAGPRRWSDVAEPWQVADFQALDPAWAKVCGIPTPGARMRALLKRPRGHSKTSDTALMAVAALAGSPRQISGVAAAATKDQARLIRDAIERLARLNEALRSIIEVQAYRVRNTLTGSTLDILSADADSSWGLNCQFILCDEICHWSGSGEELWTSLLSAAAKRECLLLIITNAFLGAGFSWQWKVADAARHDPARWYVNELPGPVASWITADRLEEQRRMLPDKVYRRVWKNEDIAEAGDFLDSDDIAAAVVPGLLPMLGRGFDPNAQGRPSWAPHMGQREKVAPTPPAMKFVAGLDGSVRRDDTAFVVVGIDNAERYRLAEVQHWQPKGQDINFEAVRLAVADAHRRFGLAAVNFDPKELVYLAQQLRREGVPMIETPFTAASCTAMATALLTTVKEQQIDLFDHPILLRDLRRVMVVETSAGGFRLDAKRQIGQGHADCAIALALALLPAGERISTQSTGPITYESSAASWGATRPLPGTFNPSRPWSS